MFTLNAAGLRDSVDELEGRLAESPAQEVVVDLSASVRQLVMPKADVASFLAQAGGDGALFSAIVRDFVRGDAGFISLQLDEHTLLIEWCASGLLDLNRGTGEGRPLVVDLASTPSPTLHTPPTEARLLAHAPSIASFTQQIQAHHPGAQVEWVLDGGQPVFVDFSKLEGDARPHVEHGVRCISPGAASGRAWVLEDDALLERLSVGPAVSVGKSLDVAEYAPLKALLEQASALESPPIVVARRPYAVLSAFFDRVGGFVFLDGGLLSHLGVMLREAKIPAVLAGGVKLQPGEFVGLTDGRLTRAPGDAT